jgi:hypothetical protein
MSSRAQIKDILSATRHHRQKAVKNGNQLCEKKQEPESPLMRMIQAPIYLKPYIFQPFPTPPDSRNRT